MRKYVLMAIAFVLFLFQTPVVQASSSDDWLDAGRLSSGAITVRYDASAETKTKLLIEKGQDKYSYFLFSGVQEETFPLQMGDGEYTISVLEQVSGTKYKVVRSATVALNMADNTGVYLNSVQNVHWNGDSEAVRIAKELTETLSTDLEKAQAIYRYIIDTVRYDNALASSAGPDYIPDIDRTISSKRDICYGYASLYAAMLRSAHIPAKLVMGTSEYVEGYHAWNEVYVNERWLTVDTTVDAGLRENGDRFEMIKDASKYTATKYY